MNVAEGRGGLCPAVRHFNRLIKKSKRKNGLVSLAVEGNPDRGLPSSVFPKLRACVEIEVFLHFRKAIKPPLLSPETVLELFIRLIAGLEAVGSILNNLS